jgi:hypothetical protein
MKTALFARSGPTLPCAACGASLRLGQYADDGRLDCPSCGRRHEVAIAPALLRAEPEGGRVGSLAQDDEAACFDHPDRRAVAVCEASGRYLCELCRVEVNGHIYSMEAFQTLRAGGEDPRFLVEETRYDRGALMLALIPLVSIVLAGFTLFSGPMAVVLAIFALTRRVKGPVRRGPWVAILALLIGLGQMAFWILLFTRGESLFSALPAETPLLFGGAGAPWL